jgi:hypothetical protein
MKQVATLLLFLTAFAAAVSAAEHPVTVWAVPSIQKVRPEDPVEASNLVWSGKTKTVTISGAKNEHVPFQIVVTTQPPPTRYEKAATGFRVETSDLVSNSGRIARDRVRLYLEHVVLCYGKSSTVGATGFWPDALAPLTGPFGMDSQFRSFVRNRAIWVDVQVPEDAPGGVYSGTLDVTRNGQPVDKLALSLRVHNFVLPQETHLITYIGIASGRLAGFYGLPENSPELKRLVGNYYEFLYANRMEPWFHDMLQPEVKETADGTIDVRFDDREYAHYMNTLKTKRVVLEPRSGEISGGERAAPFSEAFNRRVMAYVKQVYDYYNRNGWLSRLVFNSPIDEPNTSQQYAETRQWAELAHKAAPGVPFLVTESPVPDNPDWGSLIGFANNFSVHGNELNRPLVKKAIRDVQAKGGEVTWYISCDQVYPQPNYFIDGPAMDPVMVPWITWRYGMNGILYWDIAFWSQTPDPWLDPVTYLSGFLCSDGYILNGEGCMVYPGNRAKRFTGQNDVDGPVSSIRLELLREGIEDYEYLWLLKSLGDPDFADRAVQGMVVDVSAFSRNAEELFEVRQKMAARIESLKR